jgi:hypothetical protein
MFAQLLMHAGEIEAHTGYRKEVAEAGSIASCSIC